MQNSVGSNVESIILAADGQVEVPEFRVASNCRIPPFKGPTEEKEPFCQRRSDSRWAALARSVCSRGNPILNQRGDSILCRQLL